MARVGLWLCGVVCLVGCALASLETGAIIFGWHNAGTWAAFGERQLPEPNYVGHNVSRAACPVRCEWTSDPHRLPLADVVVFEPVQFGAYVLQTWRTVSPEVPPKQPWQQWAAMTFEQYSYFPFGDEFDFMHRVDINISYRRDAAVRVTFNCDWGGFGSMPELQPPGTPAAALGVQRVDSFLLPPLPTASRTGLGVFIASNCAAGGASARTAFMRRVMRLMQVDSYGSCLHNKDLPEDALKGSIYTNHGRGMRDKQLLFRNYKFVFAFENNNVTDYVTEKVYNAWLAGAVPIYMGADNIEDYAPGDHSYINIRDYPSPQALAAYLLRLDGNDQEFEEYLAWKRKPLRPSFIENFAYCAVYDTSCRLCQEVVRRRASLPPHALRARSELVQAALVVMNKSITGEQAERALDNELLFSNAVELPGRVEVYLYGEGVALHHMRLPDLTVALWSRLRLPPGLNDTDVEFMAFDASHWRISLMYQAGELRPRVCACGLCVTARHELVETNYFLAFTVDSAARELRVYINAVLDSVHTCATGAVPDNGRDSLLWRQPNLLVGACHAERAPYQRVGWRGSGPADEPPCVPWLGGLDNVSVWQRALTNADLHWLAMQRLSGAEPHLVLYWPFDERTSREPARNLAAATRVAAPLLLPVGDIVRTAAVSLPLVSNERL